MNIQKHARIKNIQKLSGYLLKALTWISYAIAIAWPLLAIIMLIGDEKLSIAFADAKLSIADINYALRLLICAVISVAFFFLLKGLYQFRELMRYFIKGEIFNAAAIEHARKALFNGLIVFAVFIVYEFAGWIYKILNTSTISISIPVIIYGCIFFGLMYVLVWALEIGRDINEESDLTI